jgi:hypothetical protein
MILMMLNVHMVQVRKVNLTVMNLKLCVFDVFLCQVLFQHENVCLIDYFTNYCSDDEATGATAGPMDTSDLNSSWGESDISEDEVSNEQEVLTNESSAKKEDPLYHGASISQWESVTSILSFVQSEHLSGVGLGRLLSLIHLHLPKPNSFLKTHARLMKLLEQFNYPVFIHYFCSVCYKFRKGACDICDCDTSAEDKCVLFFITFPLVPQLEKMFQRPGFIDDLKYKEKRTKKIVNNIEDIYDGEVYKEAESKFQNSCVNITLMWNTDGMQVFNSSAYSLWPFYFVINELPPSKRFLSENLIVGGIWGGLVKPHPNVYLLPIYKEVKSLEDGCYIKCCGDEETCKVAVRVICGVCDAPARASFMNMKQHSGFYSCPVCITKGEKPGDATVFPYEEEMVLRNPPEYEEHVKWAVEKKIILSKNMRDQEKWCGIKGPTILTDLMPNMFTSMGIDSMHCIYLGVMRQMLHLWTDRDLKEKPFSIFAKLKIANERIRNLTPPHFLQRSPQSLDKLIYWKATELRSFLFNLSLTVLKDVLQPDYYNHLALLVKGVALLNSNSISEEDLLLSSLLLNYFVSQFSLMYGAENMSHNLHMLLHLERCVRFLGPLWIISCFKFEDINGRLSNIIHGTRHIGLQIHNNLSIITQLPVMVSRLKEGAAKEYCVDILQKRNKLRITETISPGLYLVGVTRSVTDRYLWVTNLLIRKHIVSESSVVQLYSRLLKQRMLYVAKSYNRGRRVSSYVKYKKDDCVLYGLIQCFVRVSCSCTSETKHLVVIKPKQVSKLEIQGVELPHMFIHGCIDNCTEVNNCDTVNVSDLITVLFKINVAGLVFLCEPLNVFELE